MKIHPGAEVSSQSDVGCVRLNNEDSFGYWEADDDQEFLRKGRLAVVADGMGGYEGGQEASRLAKQLGGSLNVVTDRGARCVVRFGGPRSGR